MCTHLTFQVFLKSTPGGGSSFRTIDPSCLFPGGSQFLLPLFIHEGLADPFHPLGRVVAGQPTVYARTNRMAVGREVGIDPGDAGGGVIPEFTVAFCFIKWSRV